MLLEDNFCFLFGGKRPFFRAFAVGFRECKNQDLGNGGGMKGGKFGFNIPTKKDIVAENGQKREVASPRNVIYG